MYYIDTSAFIKEYANEELEKGSEKIKHIIEQAKQGDITLLSSILLIPEAISIFDKWKRRNIISEIDFITLISEFIKDVNELINSRGLIFQEANTQIFIYIAQYIIKHGLTTNDAIHLYSALLNKETIEQFICSDTNLNQAAHTEGFKIFNPEE